MSKITFINKTDKTQVFQKHSYGFMTIKSGETVDLYLDYTKDITTKAFIKSFYSPYESIFDITYSFDEDVPKPYLEFSNDGDFTLSVTNPRWDGTIEYSIDGGLTWNTWDGSELSGTDIQSIYLRGTGNSKVTYSDTGYRWAFTGKYCTGNIENLLDYQTVANGEHPVMGSYCYSYMFYSCTSLIQAPELPATELAEGCYRNMFSGCTSLTQAPKLPAMELVKGCYSIMFQECTSLIQAPELLSTTLAESCYYRMFHGCTSLTQAPKLPATELPNSCYNRMFWNCTSLKFSTTQTDEYQYAYRIPTIGTGTTATDSLTNMFTETGGTFTGTPTINTIYYTNHEPV